MMHCTKKGFTLIELLIVIGLTAILSAMVAPTYGNLQSSAQIGDVTESLVQNLRMARQKSISGYNGTPYGVKLSPTQYVVYQGTSYTLRDAQYDQVVTFATTISLSTTIAASEVNFTKGSGTTTNSGTITITHATQGNRVLTVSTDGFIEE